MSPCGKGHVAQEDLIVSHSKIGPIDTEHLLKSGTCRGKFINKIGEGARYQSLTEFLR